MLETWTHSFGLGDSQPRQNYSARRGYDLGWCEVGGSWHLVVKEIEIHTNYETFLGYKYNESFEISKTPLLEAPQALKQMASVHMAELLAEIRLKLKKLSELRGEVASL